MAGLNKISLIGNLGRDPEARYTQDGLAVTNFSMAVSEKVKGEEKTLWFKCVCFGKLGEIAEKYLNKGKQVYVEGRLQTGEWTDKEGKNRFSLEVIASQIVMLSSGNGKTEEKAEPKPSYSEAPAMPPNDDIPF